MKNITTLVIFLLLFGCKQTIKEKISSDNTPIIETEANIQKIDNAVKQEKVQISYPVKFAKIEPDSIKTDYRIDSIKVEQSIWVNSLQFIVGTIDNNKNGVHLFVKNKNHKVVYRSRGQMDAWKYELNIYKCDSLEKIVLINEISAEESWGVDIHKYDNGLYKEIGGLDLVALNEYDESMSIIPFLNITESKEDVLEFSFKKTCKIYDNELEETISGEEILYRFENNSLKRVNL